MIIQAILRFTCWVRGTNLSTLEQKRAWPRQFHIDGDQAHFRAKDQAGLSTKVEGFVPHAQYVNLRIRRQSWTTCSYVSPMSILCRFYVDSMSLLCPSHVHSMSLLCPASHGCHWLDSSSSMFNHPMELPARHSIYETISATFNIRDN